MKAGSGGGDAPTGSGDDRAQQLPAGTRLGEVVLAVTDAERAVHFWTRVLGLSRLSDGDGRIVLGTPARADSAGDDVADQSQPLVTLVPGAASPVARGRTGLYHLALHFDARPELARTMVRLDAHGWATSPTDHLETEAIYLWDPDGNGIELTHETPERGRLLEEGGRFVARTPDGRLHSGREPLDVRGLLAELPGDADVAAPIAGGVRLGHVHLHVADLQESLRFYRDVIGFRENMVMAAIGMADLHLDDSVPHALALNTWAGAGAPPPPAEAAGLRRFTLEVPPAAGMEALASRLEHGGWSFQRAEREPGAIDLADPSGNRMRVRARGRQ